MGSCWPDVRIPSGKMFLEALLVSGLESSWGAVGALEVRAGAIVEVARPIETIDCMRSMEDSIRYQTAEKISNIYFKIPAQRFVV